MRYVYLSLICLLLTGCSVISGLKMPEAWKSLGKTPDKAIAAGTTTNAAMGQVADADKKLQDAKLKIEQEYEKFRQDLELTYKKREEIDIKIKEPNNLVIKVDMLITNILSEFTI